MSSKVNLRGILCLTGLFLIILLLNGVATAGKIENLVQNPDFEEGITGWTIGCLDDGAAGELKIEKGGVVGKCLYFKVDGVGNDDWEPEIHSSNFNVEAGKTYTIAFWAKTEKGVTRPFDVCLEAFPGGGAWAGFCKSPNMTDEWVEYWISDTVNFTDEAWVHLTPKRWKEDIWLDHFRVYQGEYEPDDFSEAQATEPIGKLGTTWGDIKSK